MEPLYSSDMPTNLNAAIYARLSDRRDDGTADTSPAVARQLRLSRQLADAAGLTVIAEHIDDGVSGWSGAARPGFDKLVADVATGRAGVVVAYTPDRLARNLADYSRLFDAAKVTGAVFKFVVGGEVNPADANQDFMSGIQALVSAHESALKSTRVRAANDQAAAAGRVHRSKRAFGYQPNGVDVVPEEAAAVQEVARRIIAGASLRACCRWLNAEGIRTAGGNEWTASVLRASIMRPTLAGYRVHRGEVVPGVKGQQAAILTEAEHAQVVAQITRPSKTKTNGRRGRRPTTLGTGLFRCICGETMIANNEAGGRIYRCRTSVLPTPPRGPHTSRRREPVDALVRDVVAGRIDAGDVQRLLAANADDAGEGEQLLARQTQVRAELDDLADAVVSGALTVKQAATISAGLQEQLTALDVDLAAHDSTGVLSTLSGVTSGADWFASASLEDQRAVVDTFVTVTIDKTRSGPGFDPRSIRFGWKL